MQTTKIKDIIFNVQDIVDNLESFKTEQRLIRLSLSALREPANQADIAFSIRSIAAFAEMTEDSLAGTIEVIQRSLAEIQQTERG
ncbi:hypothetical protein SAMN02745119_02002 [Trichlorobacter thiogenes]|uniref:Uncharacterized protein n=1 Tax=Trichlorobacter thiogenes TaxID=115783 RepID=A0A1T4PKY2_9BACT|nr:hypothetical protein [Trichlorobacter thiogenes]SJZ91906.1 hypothetical protein SAMN02745119_02002 [Trichlorobacter thiogenes]